MRALRWIGLGLQIVGVVIAATGLRLTWRDYGAGRSFWAPIVAPIRRGWAWTKERVIRLWKGSSGRGASAVNPYQELYKYLHPLVVGALDRASSLSLMLCREILRYHMRDAGKADRISRRLNSSYPAHQYPITSREARSLGLRVDDLDPVLDELLQELNLLYSEMGQRAITDYDEENHHDNEITNIFEGPGLQVYYQVEKDWHYRKEERRWVAMNDLSSWYRCRMKNGKVDRTQFHIR